MVRNRNGPRMRKLPIIAGMLIGAFIGLLATTTDGAGLKIVMMSIGIIAGAAIGRVFVRPGKMRRADLEQYEELLGQGISARERMRNFWRDKGRPIRFSDSPNFDGATRHDADQQRKF